MAEILSPAANPRAEPITILLVDDKRSNLIALRAILDEDAYHLVEARSGEEALARLNEHIFSVILLALHLPALNGFDVAKRIRANERSRHTPLIFLTGDEINQTQLETGYALGAVDILHEPLSPTILQAKVRSFATLAQQKERALREAEQLRWQVEEERFRQMVEAVQDYAIFMLDPDGNVATWNLGAERIKQYKADEIIGRHFSQFYPPDVIHRGWPEYELKVAATEGRLEDEGWRVRKDGTQFWANVVITAIKNDHGRLLGFTKVTRDLTARKQAEDNARRLAEETAARQVAQEERERLRVTLASIGDAVITTDAQGCVTFLNPVAEELIGWRLNEAAGQSLEEVFHIVNENTRQPVANPALRALRDGKIVGLANHTILISKSGIERPIDDSAAPIVNERDEVIGSVLVFRDITERRRTERQRNARLAVTQALSAASTAGEGVSGALNAICEQLGWNVGFLWSVHDDGAALVCRAKGQRSDATAPCFEEASCLHAFSRGEGLPGRVWATGKPAWMLDVAADLHFVRAAAALEDGLTSAFAYPLFVGERFLGVMEFFTRRSERPDLGFQEMMETVAGAVGQFLERRRAEEELRERTNQAETLLRIGSLLSQQLDLQRLVEIVTDEGTQLCGAQFGAFFYNVLSERGESYTLYTLSGVPRETFAQFPMPRNTDLFGPTFRGEGVIRLSDVTDDARYGKMTPHYGMPAGHLPVKSYLAVPVVSRTGEVLGGLFFGHEEAGVFTAQHEQLLLGVAGQAAVAIDNARLHQRTHASAERLNLALTAADLGDWSWDAASDLVTFSERAAEVFDIPPGPHMTWTEMQGLIHPGDRDRARQEVERVIAQRAPYDIEYRVRRKDESYVHVGVLGRAIYDQQGLVTGMYGVVQDISDRRRLEESLRSSEARFRGLMEQAPFSVQVLSPDGRTIRVNRAWEELWGLTLDQIDEYNILQDQQLKAKGVLALIHQAFAGSPTFIPPIPYDPNLTLPDRTRHRDAVRWVAAVAYPLKDDHGVVQEVVLVHDDITARRNAESALRESEERLRLALDAGRMGVWDWNVRTGDLKWSDSLEPLHGLDAGTFGGTFEHFQQLIHPDDRAAVEASIRAAIETDGEFDVEFRNPRQNGSIHWIAGSGKVFYDEDGQPLRMIGVGMDVTQRKRSEQTARFLADASAALAVLVDFDSTLQKVTSLAVPHFADWAALDVREEDGHLRRVAVAHTDPAKVHLAQELHHRFPPDPTAPSGVWNILRSGQAEMVPVITDAMLASSTSDPELLRIVRELGLKSYIGVPLTVRGKTWGVLTFIVAESDQVYDETDLAVAKDLANRAAIAVENSQLYRELRDADRRKDEFLATLAHELRNPLAPIRNGLQVLHLAGGNGQMMDEARLMMERQLTHMIRLVDDLLDVSRITRNKLELRRERVALSTVIHTAVETSRPLIEQFGHTFSVTLSPTPLYLDADPVRLAQVFSNLLNNAAKYTEPGGRISLTVERQGTQAVVRVRDNGLGIPADALAKIFEMFSQVDRNLERAQGGLGIGLTLVRRLTEMHGGAVEVTSDGPGKGSEFVVRLPIFQDFRPSSQETSPRAGEPSEVKRRILVVDDNQDAAQSLGMMLKLMGNDVRTAHDGLAAVEVAELYRPEMILLDIGLPKLNGYDACRRIRNASWSRDVIIVALTGWGQEQDRRRSQDAGFDDHLVKPVDLTALRKMLAGPP